MEHKELNLIIDTWRPIIRMEVGDDDEKKVEFICKYAHYHSLAETAIATTADELNKSTLALAIKVLSKINLDGIEVIIPEYLKFWHEGKLREITTYRLPIDEYLKEEAAALRLKFTAAGYDVILENEIIDTAVKAINLRLKTTHNPIFFPFMIVQQIDVKNLSFYMRFLIESK